MVAHVNGVYLTGVARLEERLIVLLDLSRVLAVEEIDQLNDWQASDDLSQVPGNESDG
jgi:chemotaxis signal transduction protein